jgi:ubiquinone/menaquinone biosynthesis C-methylase UbiE
MVTNYKAHPRFAKFYIKFSQYMEKSGFYKLRRGLIADIDGNILEIGCGNGMNFSHYKKDVRIIAIEPEEILLTAARRNSNANTRLIRSAAESLLFTSASFEVVVATLVLCSVTDQKAALAEIYRVLKPGGIFYLLEHVGSNSKLKLAQNAADIFWPHLAGGCHLTRNTLEELKNAGFIVDQVESFKFLPSPVAVLVSPMIRGIAKKPD